MKPIATFAALAALLAAGTFYSRSEAATAVTPPSPLAPGALAGPVSGDFVIDSGHSTALFAVKHSDAARFYGRFNQIDGEFKIDAENPGNSEVRVVIPAASVDTNSDGRDQHLKGPDFFNAKEFPEIVFESTAVRAMEGGFAIEGELTLVGTTRPVRAAAEFVGHAKNPRSGKDTTGYEVTMDFKRSEFGMDFMVGPMLGDEVKVILSVEAPAK